MISPIEDMKIYIMFDLNLGGYTGRPYDISTSYRKTRTKTEAL